MRCFTRFFVFIPPKMGMFCTFLSTSVDNFGLNDPYERVKKQCIKPIGRRMKIYQRSFHYTVEKYIEVQYNIILYQYDYIV